MSKETSLTYETKCRRCGCYNYTWFSERSKTEWIAFANAMQDHIANPRQTQCDVCEKPTVQDVTSYTPE